MKKMIMILTVASLLLFLVGCENKPPTVEITNCPSNDLTSSSYTFEWSGDDKDGSVVSYHYDLEGM